MKISFKKQPRTTGLAGIGNSYQTTDIKVNKKIIGYIYPPTWRSKDNNWKINIAVEGCTKDDSNCSWRWVNLKYKPENESDGRIWIKKHLEKVLNDNDLELHYFED